MNLIDLVGQYPNHDLFYSSNKEKGNFTFDMFDESKRCFVFMNSKQSDLDEIQTTCSRYEKSNNNHVIVWRPSGGISSKLTELYNIDTTDREIKMSKKDLSSYIKSRINKTKLTAEKGGIDSFSDTIGSSDFSYDIDLDLVELRYRTLILKCVGKNSISSNDIYESLGDDIISDDSAFFVLYSKGKTDLFFYILKEKIENKIGYERDEFMSKVINYFEHEVRLKLIIASMINCGNDYQYILDSILKIKKKKSGNQTYSKNQIKFFLSKISLENSCSIKKESGLKLIAINSCRKTIRSGLNPAFKVTYMMFLIMYLMNMIGFRGFYNVASRMRG